MEEKWTTTSSPASASTQVREVYAKPLLAATAALLGLATSAMAAAEAEAVPAVPAEAKVELGPVPTDFGLKYDYYTDSQLVGYQLCLLVFHILMHTYMLYFPDAPDA